MHFGNMSEVLIDVTLTTGLNTMATDAAEAEESGYAGIWTFEGAHDPFLPILLAAGHTKDIALGTSIAVAFARNPMLLATIGWDLQAYSGGRFILGLGTQIKPHITRRFDMPWSSPAARMRDMVLAVRAIWQSWQERGALDYRGEFYQNTLMTPMFMPDPAEVSAFGPPPIWLAGVGSGMTAVAGEVADGFMSHPFCTPDYLAQVTRPTLGRGAAKAGKTLADIQIHHSPMIVIGRDDAELARARAAVRKQLAFYGSTPAYWPILELHGRADVGPKLKELSKQGEWDAMATLIDDEFLDTAAITVTDAARGARELARRYGDLVHRLGFNTPYRPDRAQLAELLAACRRDSGF
ncbi:LLM class F420-dependent oxidoreductase [Mycobacteroides franklinii]|uniref:LLM class F420-dependent oxidoreductase n=1 Tax=Mycobacteroides franklinii TaxID=948102 RepID=A0A1S1L4G7_9MYCO|nr:TIGR03617 family F420-dependent LLM class oxidoreductase [Mycobacteroides franklinii]OHU21989.1 LLM class F420-dependent oxidoreductase [Mycobacteroides franklinii]